MKKLKNICKNVMVYLVMGKEIMQYNRIKGNYINVGYLDTAMVIIPFNLCKNIKWKLDVYEVDDRSRLMYTKALIFPEFL
jgi:hypothetical protein